MPAALKKQNSVKARKALLKALGFIEDPDVCVILKIAPVTLPQKRYLGMAPPSYKVGKDHLTDPLELTAWIRSHRSHRVARNARPEPKRARAVAPADGRAGRRNQTIVKAGAAGMTAKQISKTLDAPLAEVEATLAGGSTS